MGNVIIAEASPISIHALREEGDRSVETADTRPPYFYPRPPRGGRLIQIYRNEVARVISIHALREEGDDHNITGSIMTLISIHALREEGDETRRKWCKSYCKFLSTPSARRATSPC